MIHLHKRVAILIDADNTQLSYMEEVLKLSDYYGLLETCRAYGDWHLPPLSSWREKIDLPNIERIQVDRLGKNATDHHMMIEIGEILGAQFDRNTVDFFILVSGDGDFTSACKLLKDRGKQVIVIGNDKQTAKSLRASCDEFYNLADLLNELNSLKVRHPISPSKVREFFNPLFFAYHQLDDKKEDWVSHHELDIQLRELVPDYESRFGKYTLLQWLENFNQQYENDNKQIRRIDPDPKATRLNLLISAYIKTKRPDGLASLSQLGQALRELDPIYQMHFGNKKLSDWLEVYTDEFEVRESYVVYKKRHFS